MESGSVVYCTNQPILTTITEWLMSHLGRISVGREIGDGDKVEILAYSDDRRDSVLLSNMARQNDELYIVSPGDEEANFID